MKELLAIVRSAGERTLTAEEGRTLLVALGVLEQVFVRRPGLGAEVRAALLLAGSGRVKSAEISSADLDAMGKDARSLDAKTQQELLVLADTITIGPDHIQTIKVDLSGCFAAFRPVESSEVPADVAVAIPVPEGAHTLVAHPDRLEWHCTRPDV